MSPRRFAAALVAILAAAALLRGLWLRADPPVRDSVGIVWHDEGAWVHNARNRALWGVWRTDEWNPMFVAPVFTALEYATFREFGVGLRQARIVPAVSGLVAIVFLVIGLETIGGRRAAVFGGALLATDYAFVMWNRAALMESTMTAFIVLGWAAYARAERRPAWGLVAGAAVVLAWFTKSEAAFFAAAIVIDAGVALATAAVHARHADRSPRAAHVFGALPRAPFFTLAGLAVTAAIFLAAFVIPHWHDYTFYNWQVTVTRKPDYSLAAIAMRASWLPFVESIFARLWVVLTIGLAGALWIAARWKTARAGERLLVLWIAIGLAELVAYDSGNERRYVMLIPALIALASVVCASDRLPVAADLAASRWRRLAAIPVVAVASYLVVGSLLRPVFLASIDAGHLHTVVRLTAAFAAAVSIVVAWQWRAVTTYVSRLNFPTPVSTALVTLLVVWNGIEYAGWAAIRTEANDDASIAVGRLLPAGTLVQGKLANGLSLENRIRPLFIGNGFGNYADRLRRDDVRYILTYDLPRIGYESSDGSGLIQGILDHTPGWRIVATFDVDETPGIDEAVLIDKFPNGPPAHARD